jgi:uncharacterized membrane protein
LKVNGSGGQATVLVLGMTMLVMAVAGLAVDGTKAFLFRRTLQSAADAAAIAGASEVDADRYYSTKGRSVQVDASKAGSVVRRMLSLRGLEARASVSSSEERVVVVLRGQVRTLFLRLIGIRTVPVAVEAASEPLSIP